MIRSWILGLVTDFMLNVSHLKKYNLRECSGKLKYKDYIYSESGEKYRADLTSPSVIQIHGKSGCKKGLHVL